MPRPNNLDNYNIEELLQEMRSREAKSEIGIANFEPEPKEDFKSYKSKEIITALKSKQKVIYGTDNRQDIFEVNNEKILSNADSVVGLFWAHDVIDNGNNTSTLATRNFGVAHNLCITEPFRDQPVGPFCSGFLVADNIIATAAHCVDQSNVTRIRFVFGFRMLDLTTAQEVVNNNEIYNGTAIIDRRLSTSGTDWALVRIDRNVYNHHVAEIRRHGKISNNQALHVIGHPCGLPLKYAPRANVRDNTPRSYFVANLDTYGGNSGSPVFNSDTHEVEGILVRGETDFTTGNGCNVSLICPNTGCSGEDCTRATEFSDLLPLDDDGKPGKWLESFLNIMQE
ncbi:MAG: trypsin-like peptidase domain-containing protein [candidate division Zixibacteria bacterium]|nr:trypsin-like peptidase domain-containing protein [candidate division Zixibacteria bacterium]